MIATLSWLKMHLKTNANLSQIVEKLTSIGLEVEEIKQNSGELGQFKIAKIINLKIYFRSSIQKHFSIWINGKQHELVFVGKEIENDESLYLYFKSAAPKVLDKVKIINNPTSIRNISEKLYSVKYLRFMPNTIFTQNIHEIKNFFKENKSVILKPIHSFSGNDIHLLNKFKLNFIKKFIKKHDHIMCQKYLPRISKGDKRVFLINGKICGVISRVPKKGSFLSNMSKGAAPINIQLTKLEKRISNIIAKDLKKEKIYFAGIDFIDQKLNGDINVTSPTGLKTLFDISKINLAKIFWKDLKA